MWLGARRDAPPNGAQQAAPLNGRGKQRPYAMGASAVL
jgi:hypothetical protein